METLINIIRTVLWGLVFTIGPVVVIMLFAGFSKPMKAHYSMNWIEIDDPFTGEPETRDVKLPTKRYLYLCSTVGCQRRTMVFMSETYRDRVKGFFVGADSPAGERKAIAIAISFLERKTCARVGVCDDRPDVTMFRTGQMDCVDEATNTTSYLHFLRLHGLLQFYKVGLPQSRGFPVAHWFATIRWPQGTCIVESDFNKTGQEPVITC